VRRQKGALSAEAPNVELSLGICLNEEEDPSSGFNGGWISTIDTGAWELRDIGEFWMICMRWTHMDATWPLTNNARRALGGNNLQTRTQISSMVVTVRKLMVSRSRWRSRN
jgi:hypothetical protein